jgi:hypothetical protein
VHFVTKLSLYFLNQHKIILCFFIPIMRVYEKILDVLVQYASDSRPNYVLGEECSEGGHIAWRGMPPGTSPANCARWGCHADSSPTNTAAKLPAICPVFTGDVVAQLAKATG